jgi:SepF-like predicted cell division protein (DUF552 family)
MTRTAFLLALALASPVVAQGTDAAEIIEACRERVGHLGANVVKACVNMDMEAMDALSTYPEGAQGIISACQERVGDLGWNVVKACADMDLEAERELQELEGGQ